MSYIYDLYEVLQRSQWDDKKNQDAHKKVIKNLGT